MGARGGGGAPAALPPTLQLAASLPEHGRGRPSKRKEIRDDVRAHAGRHGKLVVTWDETEISGRCCCGFTWLERCPSRRGIRDYSRCR